MKTKNEIDNRVRLLLSAQRALWGMVYPAIRGIAVGYQGKKLNIVCYLDREPIEEDFENLSDIAGQICADIDFEATDERCVYSKESFSKLDNLMSWVYIRKED